MKAGDTVRPGGALSDGTVRLRVPAPKDVELFWRLVHEDGYSERWRYRGRTVSLEEFRNDFWKGVIAQFVVETDTRPRDRRPVGLVAAYDPNLRNRSAYLSLLALPAFRGSGVMLSAARLLVTHLFRNWQLRKVYFEALEFNFEQFAGLGALIEVEGRLKEFEYFADRWWDLIVGTITRERWDKLVAEADRRSVEIVASLDPDDLVDFERFRTILADLAHEEGRDLDGSVTLDSRLVEDLGFDSLSQVVLLQAIEEHSGAQLGDEELANLHTVRDWHTLMMTASQRPRAAR